MRPLDVNYFTFSACRFIRRLRIQTEDGPI